MATTMHKADGQIPTNSTGHLEFSSGAGDQSTTASLHDIGTTGFNKATPQQNIGAIIVAVIILLVILISIVIFAYRRHKYLKKRRNSPYHVPIIEYREEHPTISTNSSVGYGTYRDLEECPINEDLSSKIEGKLTLQGLHSTA